MARSICGAPGCDTRTDKPLCWQCWRTRPKPVEPDPGGRKPRKPVSPERARVLSWFRLVGETAVQDPEFLVRHGLEGVDPADCSDRDLRRLGRWHVIEALAGRDGRDCQLCGKSLPEDLVDGRQVNVHHVEPISRGGEPADFDNVVLTHQVCNQFYADGRNAESLERLRLQRERSRLRADQRRLEREARREAEAAATRARRAEAAQRREAQRVSDREALRRWLRRWGWLVLLLAAAALWGLWWAVTAIPWGWPDLTPGLER